MTTPPFARVLFGTAAILFVVAAIPAQELKAPPAATNSPPENFDETYIASQQQAGAMADELATLRTALAQRVGFPRKAKDVERLAGQRRAIAILQPTIEASGELLKSVEGARAWSDSVNGMIRLYAALGEFQTARDFADKQAQLIDEATALPASTRLFLGRNIQIAGCDVCWEDNKFEYALQRIDQVLERHQEFLKHERGGSYLMSAVVQSIRYHSQSGKAKEMHAVFRRGMTWFEEARNLSEADRLAYQAYLISSALSFSNAEKSPAEVSSLYQTVETYLQRLEQRGDQRSDGLIADLLLRMVEQLSDTDAAQAETAFQRLTTWIAAKPSRRAPDSRALRSFVEAFNSIARRDKFPAKRVVAVAREVNAVLDQSESESGRNEKIDGYRQEIANASNKAIQEVTRTALLGKSAPGFEFVRVADGAPGKLDAFRGKVVMLDFWNVSCGPCIRGFPHLAKLRTDFESQGLEILGLTFFYRDAWSEDGESPDLTRDEHLRRLREFAEQRQVKHQLIVGTEFEIETKYGIAAHPTAVLIDRTGNVRHVAIGSDKIAAPEFEAEIKKLLAE